MEASKNTLEIYTRENPIAYIIKKGLNGAEYEYKLTHINKWGEGRLGLEGEAKILFPSHSRFEVINIYRFQVIDIRNNPAGLDKVMDLALFSDEKFYRLSKDAEILTPSTVLLGIYAVLSPEEGILKSVEIKESNRLSVFVPHDVYGRKNAKSISETDSFLKGKVGDVSSHIMNLTGLHHTKSIVNQHLIESQTKKENRRKGGSKKRRNKTKRLFL